MKLVHKVNLVFKECFTAEEAENMINDMKADACNNYTIEPAVNTFDLIRDWAKQRGIYEKGNPTTQTVKLCEEMGELSKAILKQDKAETIDAIGDCVVVLTNLAELCGLHIEDCITAAYQVISSRKGTMQNGTFVKEN